MGGSVQDTQRKAWNEAMRSASGRSATARRSDRQKKQARREKARKSTLDQSGDSAVENREYRSAVRIDALEGVLESQAAEEEEEYDELEEVESSGSKRKRRGAGGSATKRAKIMPKRLRPRSLASVLIEEAGRGDGMTKKYLDAEARPPAKGRYPTRKFCPVTGLFGVYTDPKSGIPYANLKALEQIRERTPPWMTMAGSAAYSEAVKSLRNEE